VGRGGMQDRPKRIANFRELARLWREDYRRHWRRVFEPGLHVIATHRLGVWAEGLASPLARWPVKAIYSVLALHCEYVYGSRIEPSCRIGRRVLLAHASGGIVLGHHVTVGDDCILRHNVTLGARGHTKPGDPTLGARVEVGAGAVIIGEITVGDDAVIGANAVVTGDVPPGAVVRVPLATIRMPGEAVREASNETRWPPTTRRANASLSPVVLPVDMQTPDTDPLPLEAEHERRSWQQSSERDRRAHARPGGSATSRRPQG
jgi:serine O-acetyltransferase